MRWKLDWNLQVKMQRDVRREALKPGSQPRWVLLSQWQTLLPAAWAQISELPFLLGNNIWVVTVGFLGLVFISQPNPPLTPQKRKVLIMEKSIFIYVRWVSCCVGVWWSFPVNTGVHSWEGDVLGVYGQCFPTRPTVQIDRLEPESHFNAKFGPWEQVNVSLRPP